jgi:Xaa-Pro aminopeptidase
MTTEAGGRQRTLPLSGRFSRIQRQVYELVLAAQNAGHELAALARRAVLDGGDADPI